ncbi:MAG: DUF4870 domain-containing protein [Clostridiales bacterium]|nr:DUF4870 domain-containing protein [Clostridiales bacterium]
MEQKVRGLLAYLFGWLGGLIVLFGLKDNSEQTKFNACQSITISVAGIVLGFVLGFIPVIRYFGFVLSGLVFVLQILGCIKAYHEEEYELPVISDLTRNIFKSQLGE